MLRFLVSWLFGDGLPVLTLAGGVGIGILRARIIELQKDTSNLIIKIESVAERASNYWISAPAQDDPARMIIIERDLHYISVEALRIHKEYKILHKEKLIRYNQTFLEIVTMEDDQTKRPHANTARRIGQISNIYIVRLKRAVAKKTRFTGALAFSKTSRTQ